MPEEGGTPLSNREEKHGKRDLERHVRGPTVILPPLPHWHLLSSTHHLSPWAQPLAL